MTAERDEARQHQRFEEFEAVCDELQKVRKEHSEALTNVDSLRMSLVEADAIECTSQPKGDETTFAFHEGQPVWKISGYKYPRIIKSMFMMGDSPRYVVECSILPGMLHIFNETQLSGTDPKNEGKP